MKPVADVDKGPTPGVPAAAAMPGDDAADDAEQRKEEVALAASNNIWEDNNTENAEAMFRKDAEYDEAADPKGPKGKRSMKLPLQ